ncbi:MAG: hypothetical protein GY913_35490 [Proteobacteria bacterium]|nr:hypothetical protein [Pseudomonadota bacterium]
MNCGGTHCWTGADSVVGKVEFRIPATFGGGGCSATCTVHTDQGDHILQLSYNTSLGCAACGE